VAPTLPAASGSVSNPSSARAAATHSKGPPDRSRYQRMKHNAREQRRARQVSQHIDELRAKLQGKVGLQHRASRAAVLGATVQYVNHIETENGMLISRIAAMTGLAPEAVRASLPAMELLGEDEEGDGECGAEAAAAAPAPAAAPLAPAGKALEVGALPSTATAPVAATQGGEGKARFASATEDLFTLGTGRYLIGALSEAATAAAQRDALGFEVGDGYVAGLARVVEPVPTTAAAAAASSKRAFVPPAVANGASAAAALASGCAIAVPARAQTEGSVAAGAGAGAGVGAGAGAGAGSGATVTVNPEEQLRAVLGLSAGEHGTSKRSRARRERDGSPPLASATLAFPGGGSHSRIVSPTDPHRWTATASDGDADAMHLGDTEMYLYDDLGL